MTRRLRPLLPPGLLGAALLFALPGCQTVNTTERANPSYERVFIQDTRVETDASLSQAARLVRLNQATLDSGFLKIQAELFNDNHERKQANYRFEWFDENGLIIDTALSAWKPLSLAGKESLFVTAVAPTKTATDFRLKLIEPQE